LNESSHLILGIILCNTSSLFLISGSIAYIAACVRTDDPKCPVPKPLSPSS
jgi:hypothetical protein